MATITTDKQDIGAGESVTLSFTSENADSWTINPGGFTFSLDDPKVQLVTPAVTTIYEITATGWGNMTDVHQVTVTVHPEPEVTFTADKTNITIGESVTLNWTSIHADSCSIEPGVADNLLPEGDIEVTPAGSTTYVITAAGWGDLKDQKSVTVTVSAQPVPTATLDADKTDILEGESVILTWTSSNTDSRSIAPGVGDNLPENDSITVTPTGTSKYVITATSSTGPISAEVTVTVHYPPVVTLIEKAHGLTPLFVLKQ